VTVRPRVLAAVLVAFAGFGIVSTYHVFSQAFDEPAHVAAGMEWLDRGRYTYETQHPPLARAAVALGPYLSGLRSTGASWLFHEGNLILMERGTYVRNLALARLGALPFFVLTALVVWLWTRRLFGEGAALAAVALLTTLPPVLAHAGFATTDMALTAALTLALYQGVRWLDDRGTARSLAAGAAAGLAVSAKFSAGLFLPVGVAAILAVRALLKRDDAALRPAPAPLALWRPAGIAASACLLVIWAAYRFSVGPIGALTVPAPEFFDGLRRLAAHEGTGHDAYILGQTGSGGWWYFFPVTFAVKTPIPFLLLAAAGLWLTGRRAWLTRDFRPAAPALAAVALFAAAIPSNLNIGLRHILPAYPLLAVGAGYALALFWNAPVKRHAWRAAAALVFGWQAVSTTLAHPDYLPWFNAFAGRHPERIVVAGDLDWGQDLLRLADTVRARHIDSLALAYFGSADPRRLLPAALRPLAPDEHASGWIAVSEAVLKGVGFEPHRGFEWLEPVPPVARVGHTIRLYYFPASATRSAP